MNECVKQPRRREEGGKSRDMVMWIVVRTREEEMSCEVLQSLGQGYAVYAVVWCGGH